jgi:hypothetical protein
LLELTQMPALWLKGDRPMRKFAAMWRIISLGVMAALVITLLVKLRMSHEIIWSAGGFFILLAIITAVSLRRGMADKDQKRSSFESDSVQGPASEQYIPAYKSDLPLSPDEEADFFISPVMQVASGLFKGGSVMFLGKAKVHDAENAMALTSRRLLLIMIGPDQLRRYCRNAKLTRLLESLPGEASEKRRIMWRRGAGEMRQALKGMLGDLGLSGIMEQTFCFSIPLGDLKMAGIIFSKKLLVLDLPGGERLKYLLKCQGELQGLADALQKQGVTVKSL